jgi:hypothetical protein
MKLPAWKQEWWNEINKCLIKLYHKSPRQAAAHVRECKKRFIVPQIGDILYHENPFYMAEGIIKRRGEVSNVTIEEYVQMNQ